MKINLQLGGILFRFVSERALIINPELKAFQAEECGKAEVTVKISWDWEHAMQPETERIGRDLIQDYYEEKKGCFCITRAGEKGSIASTFYTPDFQTIVCTINEMPFLEPPKMLGSILRMLPMREIFLHFRTLFLHSSQICCHFKGIVFAAPSGTGKTTQAKLWKKYRGAEIVCNDRTLIRKVNGIWRTYGYPIDGSEPVRSGRINELGCLVLLEQAAVNHVSEPHPAKALKFLMGQVVMDGWNTAERTEAVQLLLSVLDEIPVFLMKCTPDLCAVETLESMLKKRGVILNGVDF